MSKTVVVNLFAGPGAGKTTCAWAIASELKKRNIETEYVSEYAKELVWDNRLEMLDGSYEHQRCVYEEQDRRVQRLIGKVDVIVTDSPAILSLIYAKEPPVEFRDVVLDRFNRQQNFNLFINRGKEYQQTGRIHTLQESLKIDAEIKGFLRENDIYFGSYYHQTLDVLVDNIVKHFHNVNLVDLDETLAEAHTRAEKNNSETTFKKNEYYKVSGDFFDFYVNKQTGEKKFELEENDVLVNRDMDDFVR